YELGKRLDERMGASWKLTPSTIYSVLDRLESQDFVRRDVRELTGRPRARERVMYHPTDQGAVAFERWLASPERKEPIRTQLLAKIAVARPEHAPVLLAALDDYERDCLVMLAAASEDELLQTDEWGTLLAKVIEDAACEHLRAELQWVVSTRTRIIEFGGD
ncbi:MAG TPA: PadR family transcriptional regulator, partial [Thermoleophilaceae bacterium]